MINKHALLLYSDFYSWIYSVPILYQKNEKKKQNKTTKNKEKKKQQFSIMIFASSTYIVTNKRQVHILSYSFVFLCFHTNTNFHFFFAFSCNNRSGFTIKHVALKFVNFPNIGKNWELQAFFKVKSICQLIK